MLGLAHFFLVGAVLLCYGIESLKLWLPVLEVDSWSEEKVGPNFRAIHVDPHYYSWSAAVADFNHDGKMDVAAGAFYYLGPDFKVASKSILRFRSIRHPNGRFRQ